MDYTPLRSLERPRSDGICADTLRSRRQSDGEARGGRVKATQRERSERPTRALALDPGGTSGYAICDIESLSKINLYWNQAKLNESELHDLLSSYEPNFVICEDFEYRNKARSGLDLTAPRLIGVVKLYCEKTNTKLKLQKAATGKTFWTDQKLRFYDLYRRGTPHGRDAERHLLYWLVFGEGSKFIDKSKGVLAIEIEISPLLKQAPGEVR